MESWFAAASILSCVNLLSLMVDFKPKLKSALLMIGLGTGVLIVINLVVVPKLVLQVGKVIYLFTLIAPLYLLFFSLAKIKGLRFAYTFVFCLSITVFLDTLALILSAWTRNPIWAELFCLMLLIGVDGLLLLKYRQLYQEVQKQKSQEWGLTLMVPLLGLIMLFALFERPLSLDVPLEHFELKLIALAILFFSHTLIFINFIKFFDRSTLEKHNRILEELLSKMREDVSSMIDKIRETQLHRHDLHHHLAVLSACAHQHNLKEFDAYVTKLRHKLDVAQIELYCVHFSLNAVLSVYFKKARDHQIRLDPVLSIPESLPLKDIDLALILANGLENAINANLKILTDKRFIDLNIEVNASALTLVLQNPIEDEPTFLDGLPQSTQPDHGYGTIGIFALAKRNHGFAHFNAKKGRFTLIVQIPY